MAASEKSYIVQDSKIEKNNVHQNILLILEIF